MFHQVNTMLSARTGPGMLYINLLINIQMKIIIDCMCHGIYVAGTLVHQSE